MPARVSLNTRTREMHRLEVLPLRRDLELDCDRLAEAPGDVLGVDAFLHPDRPATVELFPGQEVSADPQDWGLFGFFARPCDAVLVRGEGLPEVIVWWGQADLSREVTVDLDAPEELLPGGLSVVLEADYPGEAPRAWREVVCVEDAWPARCDQASKEEAARRPEGAVYSWRASREPRHVVLEEVSEGACARETSPLTWDVVQGTYTLEEVEVDASGCAALTLERGGQPLSVSVCAPDGVFEGLGPAPGVPAQVTLSYQNGAAVGGELFVMRFEEFGGVQRNTRVVLGRVSGQGLARYGVTWAASQVGACGVRRGACGQSGAPVALEVEWGGLSRRLEGGEEAQVGPRQIWVARAEQGLARSLVCDPWRRLSFGAGQTLLVEVVTREEL
jgi:hypothetical protein